MQDRTLDPQPTLDYVPAPAEPVDPTTVDPTTVSQISATTAPPSSTPVDPQHAPAIPEIPGYAITGEIARGGMGRVYAGVDLTLDREVAIKTLLPGAKAERFVVEAKITARLPHPGIPPVHALGTLTGGTPFLAMKLVRGKTLADELKHRQDSLQDLSRFVQVFEQICQAVGFAHSQGIIHRDLKPANVMVGAFGEVQVMDWGLARDTASGEHESPSSEDLQGTATHQSTEQDLTRAGAILGTPGYLAPEQARAEVLDARADVFALGSTLATILTGKPAFFGATAIEMVQRAAAADLTDVFGRLDACGADAELIAIAKRCLAAERESRPADGRAVAEEIRAYRDGVEARLRRAETERTAAEVRATETRKRQRVVVWASGIAVSILLAGVVGVAFALLEAKRQEGIAREQEGIAKRETAEKEKARVEEVKQRGIADEKRQEAERQTTIALTVRDVMKNKLLRQASPYQHARWATAKREASEMSPSQPRAITVREVLDRAAAELAPERIEDAFPNQPLVQAEVLETIGETYEGIKEFDKAVQFVAAAQAIREKQLGPHHPATLTGKVNLVFSYLAAARLQEAVKSMTGLADALAELVNQLPDNAGESSGHPAIAQIDLVLNRILERSDPDSFAYPVLELSLLDVAFLALQGPVLMGKVSQLQERFHRCFGEDDPRCIGIDLWMAFIYDATGQQRLASDRYEELLARAERVLPSDSRILDGLREVLLENYQQTNRQRDRWIPLLTQQYESKRARLGPHHPSTLNSMSKLANGYQTTGNPATALPLFEERLQLMKARLGPDSPDTLSGMEDLAYCYEDAGKPSQSLALFAEMFKLRKTKLGADDPDTLISMNKLAVEYQDAEKLEQALPLFEECLKLRKARLGPDHPDTLLSMFNLAEGYRAAGKLDQALPLHEECLQLRKATLGPDHASTIASTNILAEVYEEANKPELALPLKTRAMDGFQQAYDTKAKKLGPQHPDTLDALQNLAEAQKKAGQLPSAIKMFEELRAGRIAALGATHPKTIDALSHLASAYQAAKDYQRAIPILEQVRDSDLKNQGPTHLETLTTLHSLGRAYHASGQPEKAIDVFAQARAGRLEKLGAEHKDTLSTTHNLAWAYQTAGQYPQSFPLFRQVYESRLKAHGPDDMETLNTLGNLGTAYCDANMGAEASATLKEFIGLARNRAAQNPANLAGILVAVANDLLRCKEYATAEELLRESVQIREQLAPDHWTTYQVQTQLGKTLLDQEKLSEAETTLLKAYEGLSTRLTKIPPAALGQVAAAADHLIALYQALQQPEEVTKWQAEREKYPRK